MDPNAALQAADQAISDLNYTEAREYLANYRSWRRGGGFEPVCEWYSHPFIDGQGIITYRRGDYVAAALTDKLPDEGAANG